MSFPNVSDLVATTIENRSKDIADNVTAHNAALRFMKEKGNMELLEGGTVIQRNHSFAENGNGGSYSGYDVLPTAAQDVLTGATYRWAQYAVPVLMSGLETDIINVGKPALKNLIKERVKVAESTMSNLINRHIYLDGTGNNGKNLTGLAAAVPLANTTGVYGGIDRSTAIGTYWRNQKFQASVDGTGAATTGAALIAYWNTFVQQVTRGTDRPSVIIAGKSLYSLFGAGAQTVQRVMDAKSANIGFEVLEFQGIPLIFDTSASGLASTSAYFLNLDYFKLVTAANRNFIALDAKRALNQDAAVQTIAWAGNLVCDNASLQGIFSNT